MSMSRKDYVMVAKAIVIASATANPSEVSGLRKSAVSMANSFQTDNPNFDRVRFLTACGFASKY